MTKFTRRDVVGLMPSAGLAVVFGTQQAQPNESPLNAEQLLVIGPLSLGDWFKKGNGPKWLSDRFGPDLVAAVDAFNSAPLYIIDMLDASNPKRIGFGDSPKYAILLVEGRATHQWENGKTKCSVSLGRMSVAVDITKAPPPTRSVRAGVELELSGTNGVVKKESRFGLTEYLTYDVTGKQIRSKV